MRDAHREQLYRAERRAFAGAPTTFALNVRSISDRLTELRVKMGDNVASSGIITQILGGSAFPDVKPVNVEVKPMRRVAAHATSRLNRITVSTFCSYPTDWLLIHELSHLRTPSAFPAHGREFALGYVDRVRRTIGEEAADRLKMEIRKEGIPLEPSPQIKAWLGRRMADGADFQCITTQGRYLFVRPSDWQWDGWALNRATDGSTHTAADIAYVLNA